MKASEVIREGRSVLFERGWHQGDFTPYDQRGAFVEDGPVCAYGALRVAEDIEWDEHGSGDAFIEAAVPDMVPIAEWNDEPERKFDEVVDLFDRAEKLALIAEESA